MNLNLKKEEKQRTLQRVLYGCAARPGMESNSRDSVSNAHGQSLHMI